MFIDAFIMFCETIDFRVIFPFIRKLLGGIWIM